MGALASTGFAAAIIDLARRRARARRLRIALAIAALIGLAAVLLTIDGGLPGDGQATNGSGSGSANAEAELLTRAQIRAEYHEGTVSKGRWLITFRPDYRAIAFMCEVPDARARTYARALREPFPPDLLQLLETKCA